MKPLTHKLRSEADDDGEFTISDKYWDSGKGAAGCIFIAKDTGCILLAHRSSEVRFEPNTWGTWGGKVNDGETPKDAVVREVEEETGYDGDYKLTKLWTFEDPEEGFQYHNYLVVVPTEFRPKLNWENDNAKWVEWGDWPTPMHFGLQALLKNAGNKIQQVIRLIKRKKSDILEAVDAPPAIVQQVQNTAPSPSQALTNAYIVAATVYGEAGREGERGMQAVMNVIMNRANGDFSKAKDVVLAPKQFSMWNGVSDPAAKAMEFVDLYRQDKVFPIVIGIVDRAKNGTLPDITGGAKFYFNPKTASPKQMEIIKQSAVKTVSIGHHDFYKSAPKVKLKKKNLKSKRAIKEVMNSQDANSAYVTKTGIVGEGVYSYELRSPFSVIRYRMEPSANIFYLDSIATPLLEHRGQGYAKAILESFFRLIKQYGGALDCDTYTTSGMAYVKPVVERFSQTYGVRLTKGTADD